MRRMCFLSIFSNTADDSIPSASIGALMAMLNASTLTITSADVISPESSSIRGATMKGMLHGLTAVAKNALSGRPGKSSSCDT